MNRGAKFRGFRASTAWVLSMDSLKSKKETHARYLYPEPFAQKLGGCKMHKASSRYIVPIFTSLVTFSWKSGAFVLRECRVERGRVKKHHSIVTTHFVSVHIILVQAVHDGKFDGCHGKCRRFLSDGCMSPF